MARVESADESVQGLVHPQSAESEWSRFRQGETLVLVHKRRICSKRQCRESKESRAEATGNDGEDEDIP